MQRVRWLTCISFMHYFRSFTLISSVVSAAREQMRAIECETGVSSIDEVHPSLSPSPAVD